MKRLFVRLASAVAVALAVLTGVLLALLPSAPEERVHSALSRQPDGLRVLFLLCEALGFPATVWTGAPGALAGGKSLLVLADAPPEPPPGPPGAAAPGAPARSRDLAHYRRFREEGGALLVLGVGDDELDFLRAAGVELGALAAEPAVAGTVRLAGGEELELPHERAFAGVVAGARELASDAQGRPVALVLPGDAGPVAATTIGPEALTNAELEEDAASAVLFVRLLEAAHACEPFDRVLFDEYALGGWRPASVPALAFSPRLAWLSVHALLLLALLGWLAAAPGPFPRDPEPLLAGSPLARARGLARTCERAGRHDLLARLLLRGTLERWCARTGLRAPPASAGAELEPAALDACLRALARGDAELLGELGAVFRGARTARSSSDGLARTARALGALEARLFPEGLPAGGASAGRKSARALGGARWRSGSSSGP